MIAPGDAGLASTLRQITWCLSALKSKPATQPGRASVLLNLAIMTAQKCIHSKQCARLLGNRQ
jgi:hypothetical protein